MATETRRLSLGCSRQIETEQILLDARHRWLRPAEICEILRNYKKFPISPEPIHMPESGSLFLFDRKHQRNFRKDGHNWRKKKDGKAVNEAHENLKSEGIDVLHCYYAHGEENKRFQRRVYWMVEEEFSHIALVHYLEIQGRRKYVSRIKEHKENNPCSPETENILNSEVETSVSSKFHNNSYPIPAQTIDTSNLYDNTWTSEHEVDNYQGRPRFTSFLDLQQRMTGNIEAGISDTYNHLLFSCHHQEELSAASSIETHSIKDVHDTGLNNVTHECLELTPWNNALENYTLQREYERFEPACPSHEETVEEDEVPGMILTSNYRQKKEIGSQLTLREKLLEVELKLHSEPAYNLIPMFNEQEICNGDYVTCDEPYHRQKDHPSMNKDLHLELLNTGCSLSLEGNPIYSSAVTQHSLNDSIAPELLKKLDSFDRWMSKELGDVKDSSVPASSRSCWETVEGKNGVGISNVPSEVHFDNYLPGPSISQDQLFNIIDFSPNWAYVGSESKVLIVGKFLKHQERPENCKWSCMFGKAEVPAQVLTDGVLCCHTPPLLKAGKVPFYLTCSNRTACSEVHEFEYRISHIQDENHNIHNGGRTREILLMRLGKLLCQFSIYIPKSDPSSAVDHMMQFGSQMSSLLKDESGEWDQMLRNASRDHLPFEKMEHLLQKLLKEKLRIWLLCKTTEGGKGPSVLDDCGQGVLHFAAALGYDWALKPTIDAGVNVNFRDVNGWTAIHWAASYGRERTVASLIHLGAAAGALTDPTPQYPKGRTPADLASANGHKGIAGYLAEASLTSHLSSINLEKQKGDTADISGTKGVPTPDHDANPVGDKDLPEVSLKSSLAAVRNATQAAAGIYQVFRIQSFQKKQLKEYDDYAFGTSHECPLSLIAVKTKMVGQHDEPVHAAALRIQAKFRGWKHRKEFLTIRQNVVKIQAVVRSLRARKMIIWLVGIIEKVILRWRRKRNLQGFKSKELNGDATMHDTLLNDEDYDFFKVGRKQTEERSQVALARVKSMVQYSEAREQYCRLRDVVTEMQQKKVVCKQSGNAASTTVFEDLVDIEALQDEDALMLAGF